MHTGLFRAFYFHQQNEIWPKTKKIFLKFNNVALCGIQNRCIWAYSVFLFLSEAEIWPKTKNIFEILQHSIQLRYDQKTKKIFLKFNNIALCGIQNKCIWAYSSFYFHQKPRYGQKTKKNIFEIIQRSIVRQLKKMHSGLFGKTFLKFYNVALCGN
ncbi:hypothetical protein PUN28_019735 [Cardiocondyla obscurior]|uniref:Uncharacterized protein n=1 Tax=Cardiocondyla obscurior TaxID=286306 RepID=A0AAW2EBA4_9HYME